MTNARASLGLFLLSAATLLALQARAPSSQYRFGGHLQLLADLIRLALWLLVATHLFFGSVIWTQRRRWDRADGATFRFVGFKALFWLHQAMTLPLVAGVTLPVALLLAAVLLSTIDVDVELAGRYLGEARRRRVDSAAETALRSDAGAGPPHDRSRERTPDGADQAARLPDEGARREEGGQREQDGARLH